MYSGIVEEVGQIGRAETTEHGWTIDIFCRTVLEGTRIGDSVAVDGVCLTVVDFGMDAFTANIQPVTARLSTLGEKRVGAFVNLERSVEIGGRLGGHYVQGHVDGMARIVDKRAEGASVIVDISLPKDLRRYVVERGFIAVDGASLTVMALKPERFAVSLVYHTQEHTTLSRLPIGSSVNLEVDVIAKYAEQLIAPY
ncbi:MAG: riboflavin synthase [Nitrolancea sp.]